MRVIIAMMKHETNTFSPVPTPLATVRPPVRRCLMPTGGAYEAFQGDRTAPWPPFSI